MKQKRCHGALYFSLPSSLRLLLFVFVLAAAAAVTFSRFSLGFSFMLGNFETEVEEAHKARYTSGILTVSTSPTGPADRNCWVPSPLRLRHVDSVSRAELLSSISK